MSKRQKLSKLAIVAGLLLTASATSFAQTESNVSQTESTSSTAIAINKAPRFDARGEESRSTTNTVSEATSTESRAAFSAARFMASTKDSVTNVSVTKAPEVRIRPTISTPDFSEPGKSKRVEFVASRGPRLPQ
jgi:hypothetical protein